MQGVQGISDIITIPGLVNVDFADVKAIMCNSGTAMLGVGVSSGKNRAEEAAAVRLLWLIQSRLFDYLDLPGSMILHSIHQKGIRPMVSECSNTVLCAGRHFCAPD